MRASQVCPQCLSANSRAHWLTWLTCTDSSHAGDTVTALLDGERLVAVREWFPENQQQLTLCQKQNSCEKMCEFAHSQNELDYWKWLKISRDIYDQLVWSFHMFKIPKYHDHFILCRGAQWVTDLPTPLKDLPQ